MANGFVAASTALPHMLLLLTLPQSIAVFAPAAAAPAAVTVTAVTAAAAAAAAYSLVHIELAAVDLSWDIIVRFGSDPSYCLPKEFFDDFVQVLLLPAAVSC